MERDMRLNKLSTDRYYALGVCLSEEEFGRLIIAQTMDVEYLPRISRSTLIMYLCKSCDHKFRVRADVAIEGLQACPSDRCREVPDTERTT